jgi:hypothetical protein
MHHSGLILLDFHQEKPSTVSSLCCSSFCTPTVKRVVVGPVATVLEVVFFWAVWSSSLGRGDEEDYEKQKKSVPHTRISAK